MSESISRESSVLSTSFPRGSDLSEGTEEAKILTMQAEDNGESQTSCKYLCCVVVRLPSRLVDPEIIVEIKFITYFLY
jgi:hypothetical protein